MVFSLSAAIANAVPALDIDDEFDQIYELSSKDPNNKPTIVAFIEIVQERAKSGTSNFKSVGQLVNYLADDYSLYANLHKEVLPAYCIAQGVDIGSYAKAFISANEQTSLRVNRAYTILGTNYQLVWEHLKAPAMNNTAWLANKISQTLKVPESEICARLESAPADAATTLSYSAQNFSRNEIMRFLSP